ASRQPRRSRAPRGGARPVCTHISDPRLSPLEVKRRERRIGKMIARGPCARPRRARARRGGGDVSAIASPPRLGSWRRASARSAADTSAGVARTGRAGVDAELDDAKLVVVIAESGRIGLAATAPALVATPALPQLFTAQLTFPLAVAGLAGAVELGRMPVVVA